MAEKNNFIEEITKILEESDAIAPEEATSLKRDFENRSNIAYENFLIEEGLIPKSDILDALSKYYKVPAMDVLGVFFEHHLVTMFPSELMKREGFIPLENDGDVLYVVASNPFNPDLPDIIGDYVSYNVAFLVGIKRDIFNAIEEFYTLAPTEVDLDYDYDDRNRGDFEDNSIIKTNMEKDPHD